MLTRKVGVGVGGRQGVRIRRIGLDRIIGSSVPLNAAVLGINNVKRICRTRFIILIFVLINGSSEGSTASTLFDSNLCRVLCLTGCASITGCDGWSKLVAIRVIPGKPLA